MNMSNEIFSDCYKHWLSSVGNQPFWNVLAKKYNFQSGESLRSAFKRERKLRGIEKISDKIVEHKPNLPRVGIFDVEILPMTGMMWQLWDVDFSPEQVLQDTTFLSWAGKFLGNNSMYSDILSPEEAIDRDPQRIVHSAFEFISQCDILVGHNFKAYDQKVLNTVFLEYEKPLRYRTIDTLEVAKNNFKFASNKLAFINKKLNIRQKISNEGFALWRKCAEGDGERLEIMLEYNIGDIFSTEDLFLKFQPYINNMPNFSLYDTENNTSTCHCGNTSFNREGFWFTNSAEYEKYRCNSCGALMRGKKNLLSKEKKDSLMVRL